MLAAVCVIRISSDHMHTRSLVLITLDGVSYVKLLMLYCVSLALSLLCAYGMGTPPVWRFNLLLRPHRVVFAAT